MERGEIMSKSWTRRDFLKAGSAAATALAAGSALGCGQDAPLVRPKNVLLITADDLGWYDLSSYGNPNISTPNIDRLKAGGVSFTRAFDVTSTCSSSRASYATGQYPHTHGVTGLVHRLPELSLPAGTLTLASELKAAGMRTAIHGKWHLAAEELPGEYGYTEVMTSFAEQWIFDSERSVRFIERNSERRFFFEINYMNPHRDIFGDHEQHEDHPVDPDALEWPEWMHLPDVPGARVELAAYYSQIERMDTMIGELLAALDATGVTDETLIAFISDNGAAFPHNKLSLYDRGTGTPLIFHWPEAIPAGLERNELAPSIDLMPTLLDAIGREIPESVQGGSILPLLLDPDASLERDAIFSEMTFHSGSTGMPMRSVRSAGWRYIRNYSDAPLGVSGGGEDWAQEIRDQNLPEYPWGQPRVPEELYDVSADPQQRTNLVDDPSAAQELQNLRARLDAHMEATADPYLGRAFETSE